MFHGTTIEELIQMVQRAEDHARMESQFTEQMPRMNLFPGFFYGTNGTGSDVRVGAA